MLSHFHCKNVTTNQNIEVADTKRNHPKLFNERCLIIYVKVQCYVMLWPALTWRGQEWAQHVQGQLLHTCIMQVAGSSHVMELLTDSI